MSTDATSPAHRTPGTVRYEVSASEDAVHLSLQRDGRDLSVSTDPASALLLASDILEAVGNTTTADSPDDTRFVFDR